MLDIKDVYLLSHYDYGEACYGSLSGMNYRINRDPFVYSKGASKEDQEAARLVVYIWPGPLGFTKVDKNNIITKDFDYTEEGKKEAVDYINDSYLKDKERWDEIKKAGLLG